jgi:hypothetical protein
MLQQSSSTIRQRSSRRHQVRQPSAPEVNQVNPMLKLAYVNLTGAIPPSAKSNQAERRKASPKKKSTIPLEDNFLISTLSASNQSRPRKKEYPSNGDDPNLQTRGPDQYTRN